MAKDVLDEESRPMPAAILRQQGIHPHSGPRGHGMVSILDDEYWDQCGWITPETVALCPLSTGSMPLERPRREWWDVIPNVLLEWVCSRPKLCRASQ